MKKYFSLCAFLIFSVTIPAQTFNIDYQIAPGITAFGVDEMLNQNYAYSGFSGNNDWILLRTNSNGSVLSCWNYNATQETQSRVKQTPDSGFVLFGRGNGLPTILKVSKTGAVQWSKSIGSFGGYIEDVEIAYDNNIIVSLDGGNGYGIMKMDPSNGNVLWTKRSTSSSLYEKAWDITKNFEGGYVVVGSKDIASNQQGLISKFDANGNLLWEYSFLVNSTQCGARHVVQTSDSGYVMATGVSGTDWLYKVNKNGVTQWCKKIQISNLWYWSFIAKPSGGFYVLCQESTGNTYYKIADFDNVGNLLSIRDITELATTSFAVETSFLRTSAGAILAVAQKSGGALKGVKLTSTLAGCSNTLLAVTLSSASVSQGGGVPYVTTTPALSNPTFTFSNLAATSSSYCSVSPLTVSASQANVQCNSQCNGTAAVTPLGGTAPYTYSWVPGSQTTSSVSGLCAGTYTVIVTDASSSTKTTAITITQPAAITTTISSTSSSLCSGSCANLNISATGGTAPFTYSWVPTNQTSSLAAVCPTLNTTYTCIVTDNNLCPKTSTVSLNVNPTPTISVNSGSICSGASFTIVPNGATTYTIQGGSAVVSPGSNATYTVSGTSAAGCISAITATSAVTVNSLPTVSASTNNSLICVGQTATLTASGAVSYTWSPGGVANSITVSPAVTSTYVVSGTGANGCMNSFVMTQSVSACTDIHQLSIPDSQLILYPNPFQNKIIVEGATEAIFVFNALGSLVKISAHKTPVAEIDLNEAPPGIYFIRTGSSVKKVIKE